MRVVSRSKQISWCAQGPDPKADGRLLFSFRKHENSIAVCNANLRGDRRIRSERKDVRPICVEFGPGEGKRKFRAASLPARCHLEVHSNAGVRSVHAYGASDKERTG